jgi:hypothetical protein
LLEKKKNKSPAKKSGEARKAKGQKGRGLGGEEFLPFAIKNRAFPHFLRLREDQNRKFFISY